jgi:hypothetical protein
MVLLDEEYDLEVLRYYIFLDAALGSVSILSCKVYYSSQNERMTSC